MEDEPLIEQSFPILDDRLFSSNLLVRLVESILLLIGEDLSHGVDMEIETTLIQGRDQLKRRQFVHIRYSLIVEKCSELPHF